MSPKPASNALASSHNRGGCFQPPSPSSKKIYRKGAKVAKGRGGEELIVICYWLLGKRKSRFFFGSLETENLKLETFFKASDETHHSP
jgi:hypothetical protein